MEKREIERFMVALDSLCKVNFGIVDWNDELDPSFFNTNLFGFSLFTEPCSYIIFWVLSHSSSQFTFPLPPLSLSLTLTHAHNAHKLTQTHRHVDSLCLKSLFGGKNLAAGKIKDFPTDNDGDTAMQVAEEVKMCVLTTESKQLCRIIMKAARWMLHTHKNRQSNNGAMCAT